MMQSEYELLEVIGRGSYGVVRKVRRISDDHILVRKEVDYHSMNAHERNQLILELKILRGLDHRNIVKYLAHDHIPEKHMIHIYMEYCDGGDVALVITTFKKNKDSVPEEFVWEVLVQTLLALHRCHYGADAKPVDLFLTRDSGEPTIDDETVVIHRDIKPDNIFLSEKGSVVKLGDFGLAKMLTLKNEFAKTYVGTPYYMLPEVLMDEPYSPLCDIWLLGCVLYELCSLHPPFQANSHIQLQEKIKKGHFKPVPETYSLQLRTIIHDCITVDIEDRPLVHVILDNLAVKFLRKELELKERTQSLQEYQKQLTNKAETLKEKESYLEQWQDRLETQKDDLGKEYTSLQKKFNSERQRVEDELMDEFSARKRAMDQEAKEVRLGYAREFKLVVEQEVQLRVKEILKKANSRPVHSSPSRDPLKMRNEPYQEEYKFKAPAIPTHQQSRTVPENLYRTRITDAFEKITLESRHTPEYEEVQLRKNYRNIA